MSDKPVQVEFTQLVKVEFRGRVRDPLTRLDDDGWIARFLEWRDTEDIYSQVAESSGGGCHIGYYRKEDADKILYDWIAGHIEHVDIKVKPDTHWPPKGT